MKTPASAPESPNDGGDDYEMVMHYFDDSPGDNTILPPTPERIRERERDRENIERYVAWAKREQDKLNTQRKSQRHGDKESEIVLALDEDNIKDQRQS
jgi:hypothetical protein